MIPVKKNLIKTVRDTRLGRTSDHFFIKSNSVAQLGHRWSTLISVGMF